MNTPLLRGEATPQNSEKASVLLFGELMIILMGIENAA